MHGPLNVKYQNSLTICSWSLNRQLKIKYRRGNCFPLS